jgi:hypothetical protein
VTVSLAEARGFLHADLRFGANVASAKPLVSNMELSNRGVQLFGAGFIVSRKEAATLGLGIVPGLERHVREYRNGRDLMASPRDAMVIDLFGLGAEAVRERFPAVFQWVMERVKPERDQNNRAGYRDNWWILESRGECCEGSSLTCPATSPPSKPRNTLLSSSSTPACDPTTC